MQVQSLPKGRTRAAPLAIPDVLLERCFLAETFLEGHPFNKVPFESGIKSGIFTPLIRLFPHLSLTAQRITHQVNLALDSSSNPISYQGRPLREGTALPLCNSDAEFPW